MSTALGFFAITVAILGIGILQLNMSFETTRHNKAIETLLAEIRDRLKMPG
jgi:uncharacterized protein YggT (Ycf19 family)